MTEGNGTYYKVVRRAGENDLRSCIISEEGLRVEYKPGVPARGKYGPLLVFGCFSAAEEFRRHNLWYSECNEIWTCTIDAPVEVPFIITLYKGMDPAEAIEVVTDFWSLEGQPPDEFGVFLYTAKPPWGTVGAWEVTLEERVA